MSSLIPSTDLQSASSADLKATTVAAVDAAPEAEKKDAVAAAAETLTPAQQLALAKEITGRFPQGDVAKTVVYVTGFVVAGAVIVLAGLIAWKAQGGTNSIASELIVAATSFVSLLIGGLVGAYVQR